MIVIMRHAVPCVKHLIGPPDFLARDPAGHGDTIRVRTEIVSPCESKSRDDSGIVFFRHHSINQRDEIVWDGRRGPDAQALRRAERGRVPSAALAMLPV
jgi:hypothetical protein